MGRGGSSCSGAPLAHPIRTENNDKIARTVLILAGEGVRARKKGRATEVALPLESLHPWRVWSSVTYFFFFGGGIVKVTFSSRWRMMVFSTATT